MKLFCAALSVVFGFAGPANAMYTITIAQSGLNVVANGSGTINQSGLSCFAGNTSAAKVFSNNGTVAVGASGAATEQCLTVAGPATFGGTTMAAVNASSESGDPVAINEANQKMILPSGYSSGTSLSSTATWNSQSLSTLGLKPGVYTYTWGTGANADCMVINIQTAGSASSPALSVFAAHSCPFFQTGPGFITLTVGNTGSAMSGAATVSDTFDSAFTINGVSSGCSVSGQTVTCTIASGSSAGSTSFIINVTASATAGSSISNTVTLTDGTDTITSGSSTDTIVVSPAAAQVDSSLTQLMLSGSTDNGSCASGNRTLTATDQLQNIGGNTLTNPYAVISTLSGGNSLISQTVDSAVVVSQATATFTFHIQLATCNTFQIFFDVKSN